jgi:hypothetical protein
VLFSVTPTPEGILELRLPSELPAGIMWVQLDASSTLQVTRCDRPPRGCLATQPFELLSELNLAFDVVD